MHILLFATFCFCHHLLHSLLHIIRHEVVVQDVLQLVLDLLFSLPFLSFLSSHKLEILNTGLPKKDARFQISKIFLIYSMILWKVK